MAERETRLRKGESASLGSSSRREEKVMPERRGEVLGGYRAHRAVGVLASYHPQSTTEPELGPTKSVSRQNEAPQT